MEWPAEVEDLFHDVALLVDLDGIDAAVAALELELLHGAAEGVVDLADAMTENVGEPQEDRQLDSARLQLIDQLFEVDRLVGALVGLDDDVARLIDAEITFAPIADAIH